MNYLALAQMVHRLIGAGDAAPGSAPTNMTALAPGLETEIGGWVNDAYREICADQDHWAFMIKPWAAVIGPPGGGYLEAGISLVTFSTLEPSGVNALVPTNPVGNTRQSLVIGDAVYDASSVAYGALVPLQRADGCRILLVDAYDGISVPTGQTTCDYVPPARFRGWYDVQRTIGRPSRFTIGGDGLALSAVPDRAYRLRASYRVAFVPMAENDDEPIIPARWRAAIAYRAAAMYCEQRPDTERYAPLQMRYRDLLDGLRGEQLPEPGFDLGQYCR